MNRNVKYNQVCRLSLCGSDDLIKCSATSTYSCNNNGITNSKRMRFSLNNSLGDVKLSQNAKCILESCFIPSAPYINGNVVYPYIHLLMYSTIKVRNGIQATPQGRRHLRAGVGFELAIKRQPARRLDH